MRRGTTPTHTFLVPIDASDVKMVRVIYSQQNRVVLTKEYNTYRDGKLVVKLSQKDTLAFDSNLLAQIQVRVLTLAGEALASNIIQTCVSRILEDEVLV